MSQSAGGAVYTRWGKKTCPSTAELVYSGRIGGSFYDQKGGASNYLCMPDNPDYQAWFPSPDNQATSPIYGTEFETDVPAHNIKGPLSAYHDDKIPCAVCSTAFRAQVLMIPAKLVCPSSWTLEYSGFLMSNYHGHYRTMFVCVDKIPDVIPGAPVATNGAVLYHTEAACNGLRCPPYDPENKLTCVVCTK